MLFSCYHSRPGLCDLILFVLPEKRSHLSVSEKLALISKYRNGDAVDIRARRVRDWIKSESLLEKLSARSPTRKSTKDAAYPTIDEIVLDKFSFLRHHGIPVSGATLRRMALEVAVGMGLSSFKASNRWLRGFQKRNDLSYKKLSGEKRSADIILAKVC